jgi:hypothetical protein
MTTAGRNGSLAPHIAEILGDPYSKKSPLPRNGNTTRLPVTPSLPDHRILGKSRILNRISNPYTILDEHQQNSTHNSREHLLAVTFLLSSLDSFLEPDYIQRRQGHIPHLTCTSDTMSTMTQASHLLLNQSKEFLTYSP